jgi:hypothetical protein
VAAALDLGGATSLEIPNGTDPDVDAAGEIAQDTDGANETGDVTIRAFDGTNQWPAARKLVTFHGGAMYPNDFDDAERDKCPLWTNETGMTFTVVRIKAWSDDDDVDLTVKECDADGVSNAATVDALQCTTGSGPYTDDETTISGATIEAGHTLWTDFDDTDDPGYVFLAVTGWFNANVD